MNNFMDIVILYLGGTGNYKFKMLYTNMEQIESPLCILHTRVPACTVQTHTHACTCTHMQGSGRDACAQAGLAPLRGLHMPNGVDT